MSEPKVGLLDTSIFIAREGRRPLGELPGRVAVSVITIGELQLGVMNAPNDDTRARRADTLSLARSADPIPISEAIMGSWARLVADCRAAGIHRMVRLTDALIARRQLSMDSRWLLRTATTKRFPARIRRCGS